MDIQQNTTQGAEGTTPTTQPEQQVSQKQSDGQSLVEMSLILPLLLMILFGIVEIGWYVYGYGSIYQAARNGSEAASLTPPWPSRLTLENDGNTIYDVEDECVEHVISQVQKGSVLMDLNDISLNREKFSISYLDQPDGQMLPMDDDANPRKVGNTVQVAITYTIEPLTPLYLFVPVFSNEGKMTVYATSLRTIQAQGQNFTCTKVITST